MVGRQNADIADALHLRDVAIATGRCHGNHVWLSIYGVTQWRHLANTTEPSLHVRRQCGHMSNYFDHLF